MACSTRTASARQDNVGAYALATVVSDRDRDVVLRIGSDDGLAVYVNGEEVHRNFLDRAWALDQDTVRPSSRAGDNQILCKVTQGGAQWSVSVRVTENDSRLFFAPEGLPVSARPGVIGAWWFTDRVGSQRAYAMPTSSIRPARLIPRSRSWWMASQRRGATSSGRSADRVSQPSRPPGFPGGPSESTVTLSSRQPMPAGDPSLGSDDDIYVWLNGELVHRIERYARRYSRR